MFKFALVSVLLGLAASASLNLGAEQAAEIRSLENVPADAEGNFAYAFDTTNGISVQESGNIGGVTGAAKYVSPEGIPIELSYVADQDGYRPAGAHLPVSPPIPEQIIRSLQYISSHPQYEENKYEQKQSLVVKQSPFRG